jgi:hypothetical protein
MTNQDFLLHMRAAAAARHPFPEYAACEAAYETNFGASPQFVKGHSCFNTLQRAKPMYRTMNVVYWKTINGKNVQQVSLYMAFPDEETSFAFRLTMLNTGGMYYEALHAKTGAEFVRTVSGQWKASMAPADGKTIFEFADGAFEFVAPRWAMSPGRAAAVLAIYEANEDVFAPEPAPASPAASLPASSISIESEESE